MPSAARIRTACTARVRHFGAAALGAAVVSDTLTVGHASTPPGPPRMARSDGRSGLVRYVVIGGGIVGLATAHRLILDRPDARVTVVEKESGWGAHQTGH